MEEKESHNKLRIILLISLLLLANIAAWSRLGPKEEVNRIDFLDVGQGDSALVRLNSGGSILIDAGPDREVLRALEAAAPNIRYIDLAIVSHPQLDHFNGFRYLLEQYSFGAFVVNGRSADNVPEWEELLEELGRRNVPIVVLAAGDGIRSGGASLDILGPMPGFLESAELNDTALLALIKTADWTALFPGDAGINIESRLDLRAVYILKVGHHGSKYSTGEEFLRLLQPRVALIGVGRGNNYGHPASSTLDRLQKAGASIFRTDLHGNIAVYRSGGVLRVEHAE